VFSLFSAINFEYTNDVLTASTEEDENDPYSHRARLEAIYQLTEELMVGSENTAKHTYQTSLTKAQDQFQQLSEYGTVHDQAQAMAKSIPNIKMLLNIQTRESVEYTSKLMISLAKGVHGDLDARGGSGYGEHEAALLWLGYGNARGHPSMA
jgi:hypothetical protein